MKNKIAIVLGAFHQELVQQMLKETRMVARQAGLKIVQEVWVPGSMEKPLMIKRLLSQKNIDGVVVLGIIEKGDTKHGLVMGQAVTSAIIGLQLQYNKPVGMGILGPEIKPEQIRPRLKPYAKNAVLAVEKMLQLLDQS